MSEFSSETSRPKATATVAPRSPFELPDVSSRTIGIFGGTGEQGRGLAIRWAAAGHRVIIGSRDLDRAAKVAAEVQSAAAAVRAAAVSAEAAGGGPQTGPQTQGGEVAAARTGGTGTASLIEVIGTSNVECAERADVAVIAVPWAGHRELVAALADALIGKIVIDCVNPLGFDKQGAFALEVSEGSAAQQAQVLLPDSMVTAAFHHVSAVRLLDPGITNLDTDVLVLGDNRDATDVVRALAGRIPGIRGIYAGRLRNARQVEALTANLISINRRYKSHAGVRITDL